MFIYPVVDVVEFMFIYPVVEGVIKRVTPNFPTTQ